MGKISDSRVELLRPDYGDANALLMSGIKSIQDSPKPFMDSMKANFDYRKDEATGILNQYITQNDPTQPGFQEGLQALMGQVNYLGNGVSQGDIAKSITTRQQDAPINEQRLLANLTTQDTNKFNAGLSKFLSGDKSDTSMQNFLKEGEGSTYNYGKGLQEYAQQNAVTDALRTGSATEIAKLIANLGLGAETSNAALQQGNAFFRDEVSSIDTSPGGRSSGKQSSYQSTPSNGSSSGGSGSEVQNIINSLTGTESSGNSRAINVNKKDGKAYGGLIQMGDARLKDYANATGTRAVSARNFRNLSASQQASANEWHINDLIKQAKASGGIGKVVHGTKMTLGSLVAVGHLGGGGNIKKFLTGRYNPQDELKTKLSDYARKHAGSEGGSSSGNSSGGGTAYVPREGNYTYGDSEVIPNQMKLNSAYNEDTMSRVFGLIQGIKGEEVGNFGVPKLGAPGEGSALNASLTGLIGKKYEADVGLIRASTDNLIEGSKQKTENVLANQAENKQLELERLAAEYAAAQDGVVNLSDVLDDVPGFEKALQSAGISKEMFGQLPTNQQVSYLEPYQAYEAANKQHYKKANAYKIPGALSTAKSDKINKKKGRPEPSPIATSLSKTLLTLNDISDTKTGKEFREEGFFKKAGWLGVNAQDKRNNYNKFNEDIVHGVANILLGSEENRKIYDGLFTEGDIQSLTLKIQKDYFNYANNNHTNRTDIGGVGKKVVNPRKLEELTNKHIKTFTQAANAKLKLNQTKDTPVNPEFKYDLITLKNIHGEK